MKKILFAIDLLPGGGAEKVLIELLKRLDRSKFSITLFLIVREGVYLNQVPSDVNIIYLFESLNSSKNSIFRFFRRAIRSLIMRILKVKPAFFKFFVKLPFRYDVGISFCEGVNALLFVGMREHFHSTISWIHIDIGSHRFGLALSQFERIVRQFTKVVFVSKGAQKVFESLFPSFDKNKLLCVYNPIDCVSIREKGKEQLDFDKEGIYTIIAVGRLSLQKRFDRLIRVQRKLVDDGFDVRVLILGEGGEKERLLELIDELKVHEYVKIIPFQENPYKWMSKADLFVLSSDYEGLPLVIAEAMCLALPVVSTRIVGPCELLENGKYGMLVENNEEALFAGIAFCLNNPSVLNEYRKKLSENQDGFVFNNSINAIEELLFYDV